jgi:hypothetical protein
MTPPVSKPASRSRWMDWEPRPTPTAHLAETEPTKPSKPGSVGFEGMVSTVPANIRADNRDSEKATGSVRDTPHPASQRSERDVNRSSRDKGDPGVDFATRTTPMSWCAWKAAALNRLFLELGTSGQLGRITEDTVRHGERAARKRHRLMHFTVQHQEARRTRA